jgi:hypothetical protein
MMKAVSTYETSVTFYQMAQQPRRQPPSIIKMSNRKYIKKRS